MGIKWENEIDTRIMLYKTFNEKKRMVIDFSDSYDDHQTEFEIKYDCIYFYPRKN